MRLIIVFLLCVLGGWGCILQGQPKREVRAVWMTTAYGLDWPQRPAVTPRQVRQQQEELCRQLDLLRDANFNTVLFQVRIRGDVAYPSVYEPFSDVFAGKSGRSPGYDPLAFAINECHKRGMELHAWMVAIPLGTEKYVRSLGKLSVVSKKPQLCKRYQGGWYLDPGNPATADYLGGLVDEVVRNYDVDGIHLDYIRYPDRPRQFPDDDTYKKYGFRQKRDDWRRANITFVVRKIYHTVKARKPWVKVSSAPVGKFRDTSRYSSYGWNAYHTVYQDAQGWLKEGIHDLIFPMMYFKDNQFFPFALDWQENAAGRYVVPGLGVYFMHPSEKNWSLGDIERQIHFTRQHGMGGQAYYRAQFVMENTKGLLDALRDTHYPCPALSVAVPQDAPRLPLPPTCFQVSGEVGASELKWQAAADTIPYYNVYASDTYPVEVNDVRNVVAMRVPACAYRHVYVYPGNEKKYYAVTALDRYGNESVPLQMKRDEAAYFRTDGQILYLPPWWWASSVVVTDLAGNCLLQMPFGQQLFLEHRLCAGSYRLLVTDAQERVYSYGLLVQD